MKGSISGQPETGGSMDTKYQKKHESDMTSKEKRELERQKLSSMTGKEKAEYILTYYKMHIAVLVGAVALIIGIVMWIDSFQNETVLYAAVINGGEMDSRMMEHFQAYRGDDNRRHKYVLDTSVASLSQDGSGQMDYANRMKIVTLVGANTADLFICPESIYQEYSKEENFLVPAEQLLGAEFTAAHADICEKDAVRVENSEMLERYGYQNSGPAYLIVFQYSGQQEAAADFIKFLVEE